MEKTYNLLWDYETGPITYDYLCTVDDEYILDVADDNLMVKGE